MSTIRLLPRQQLWIENAIYKVVRRTGDNRIAIENVQTLAPRTLSDAEVATLFASGALSFVDADKVAEDGFDPRIADFTIIPEHLRAEALRRESYVRAVQERSLSCSARLLKPLIEEVARDLVDRI